SACKNSAARRASRGAEDGLGRLRFRAATAEGNQRRGDFRGRLVAASRVLGEHAADNRLEPVRDVVAVAAKGDGLLLLVGHQLLQGRAARERRATGKQVVEGATQAVDVGTDVR